MPRCIIYAILLALCCLLGCTDKRITTTQDPVFHCGEPHIDTQAYAAALDTAQLDSASFEGIQMYTRWFIIGDMQDPIMDTIEHQIIDNLRAVNAAYQGYVHWERDSFIYYIDPADIQLSADLEDRYRLQSGGELHVSHLINDEFLEEDLTEQHGEMGVVSVFVLPNETNLLGYTKLYQSWLQGFEDTAPALDNIYLSYDAMMNRYNYVNGSFEAGEDAGLTVIHEFGHFGSMQHWFDNHKNFMSYHCYRDHFTLEQLEQAVLFIINYRSHLIR